MGPVASGAMMGASTTSSQDPVEETQKSALEGAVLNKGLDVAGPMVAKGLGNGTQFVANLFGGSSAYKASKAAEAVKTLMDNIAPEDPRIPQKMAEGAKKIYAQEQLAYQEATQKLYTESYGTKVPDNFRETLMYKPNAQLAIENAEKAIANPGKDDLAGQTFNLKDADGNVKYNPTTLGYWSEMDKYMKNKAEMLERGNNPDMLSAGKFKAAAMDIRNKLDMIDPKYTQARALSSDFLSEKDYLNSTAIGKLSNATEGNMRNSASKLLDGTLPQDVVTDNFKRFNEIDPQLSRGILRRSFEEKMNPTSLEATRSPLDVANALFGNQNTSNAINAVTKLPGLEDIGFNLKYMQQEYNKLQLIQKSDTIGSNKLAEIAKKFPGTNWLHDQSNKAAMREFNQNQMNFITNGSSAAKLQDLAGSSIPDADKPFALLKLIAKQGTQPQGNAATAALGGAAITNMNNNNTDQQERRGTP